MYFTRYAGIGKSKELKPEQRCIFFKGGEKDSQAPSDDFLLDLADWLLGCHGCTSITVKFGQSGVKESSAPPFAKYNINILTFLLRVFKRLAAPPCFLYSLCLCAAVLKKDSSARIVKGQSGQTRRLLLEPLKLAFHGKMTRHPGVIRLGTT